MQDYFLRVMLVELCRVAGIRPCSSAVDLIFRLTHICAAARRALIRRPRPAPVLWSRDLGLSWLAVALVGFLSGWLRPCSSMASQAKRRSPFAAEPPSASALR